jgi:hypothetical protein
MTMVRSLDQRGLRGVTHEAPGQSRAAGLERNLLLKGWQYRDECHVAN